MTYVPDIRNYQQLTANDPYGPYNCTAYAAALLVDASTLGKHKVTGRQVRAATDEPKPDPHSPGLNLPQVDAATHKLAGVSFDTRLGDPILDAETRIRDGRYAEVQVQRGVLVDHGMAGTNGFRGGHAIAVRIRLTDGIPLFGDPLVPQWIVGSWGALWSAAGKIAGSGRANAMFTRDLIPDYEATVEPSEGHLKRMFHVFTVKGGVITKREVNVTAGFTRPCTPPRFYPWPRHHGRSLVQLLEGDRKGLYVRSEWAKEV